MRKLTTRTAPRNRRVSTPSQRKQKHLLDVKVRARTASRQRNRRIVSFVCSAILLVAVVGGSAYGIREALTKFLWENPDYNLTDLEITTDGTLRRDEIIEAAQIEEGGNIFSLSLSTARESIGAIPQVESVELQRVLPNRIVIRVAERKPIAWIAQRLDQDPTTATDAFLVDSKGILMGRGKDRDLREYLNLPIISGVNMDNLRSGAEVGNPDIQAALDLIRLNIDNPRFDIRTLDLSKGYCIVATDRKHAEITFGLERMAEQIDRLSTLLDYAEPRKKEIHTANLMPVRNVPVTFYDPETNPAPVAPMFGDPSAFEALEAPRTIPPRVMKALPVGQ